MADPPETLIVDPGMRSLSGKLSAHDRSRVALELAYRREAAGIQRRFEGREKLMPCIDFAAYETRAVVDWLELEFTLKSPTQGKWVSKEVEAATGYSIFARRMELSEGAVGDIFRIRLQEADPKMLRLVVNAVERRWGFLKEPSITGIEVAIDFRPKNLGKSEHDRARMYGVLVRHHDPDYDRYDPASQPRMLHAGSNGKPTYVLGARNRRNLNFDSQHANESNCVPMVDSTYYVGPKAGPVLWRVMDKILDRQNPSKTTKTALAERERRCRIEVSVSRAELPAIGLHQFSDVLGYNFTNLRKRYFHFQLPTVTAINENMSSPNIALMKLEEVRIQKFLETGVVGVRAMDRQREQFLAEEGPTNRQLAREMGVKRKSTPRIAQGETQRFVAYGELNRRVDAALARLSKRWEVDK